MRRERRQEEIYNIYITYDVKGEKCTYIHIYTYIYTHTHTHIYIYTYIDTYIDTYIEYN